MTTPIVHAAVQNSIPEAVSQCLLDLKSKNEKVQESAVEKLRSYVDAEGRDRTNESYGGFLGDLTKRIFDMIGSSDPSERVGGIMALDALISGEAEENSMLVSRFANLLRLILPCNDVPSMVMASKALGKLARHGGTIVADMIEFEIKRAFEGLNVSDARATEAKRLASVLVLKELAENAPTQFNSYVPELVERIWVGLRDSRVSVRTGAVDALRASLVVMSTRRSDTRQNIYMRMYNEAVKSFRQNNPDATHGSLLVFKEMLLHTGEFLTTRFREVCSNVMSCRDHKDVLIRRTTINLIPVLAQYNADMFMSDHIVVATSYLLQTLKKSVADKGPAFLALGELAMIARDSVIPIVEDLFRLVRESLAVKGKKVVVVPEAYRCVKLLAMALGAQCQPQLTVTLPSLVSNGISRDVVDALTEIGRSVPALREEVQWILLDLISYVLRRRPYDRPSGGSSSSIARRRKVEVPQTLGTMTVPNDSPDMRDMTVLALETFSKMPTESAPTGQFMRASVLPRLEDNDGSVRKAAALCCSSLLMREKDTDNITAQEASLTSEALERLLIVGVSDPEPTIRLAVLNTMDSRFDSFLAQADCIRSLFIALNDEAFQIREAAICLIGRLTQRNPAYVVPSMRKMLIQLLTELEYGSEARNREEAARLLGMLISSSKRLVGPYVEPILKVLHPRLKDSNSVVASCSLSTLGELAIVGGHDVRVYCEDAMPLLISALEDASSVNKREVAARTLGQLIGSTGYVIDPYIKYPELMPVILSGLQKETSPSIRIELIRSLGTLGALDPLQNKRNMSRLQIGHSKSDDGQQEEALPVAPSSDEYYPAVAIGALVKILGNSTLSMHHTMVVQAIMFLFKTLGVRCVPFLKDIMPPVFQLLRSAEPGLRDSLFQHLGSLVAIVHQHIRPYLDEIFAIVRDFWPSTSLRPQILFLIEEVSGALREEFKSYVPDLLPQMLAVLNERSDRQGIRSASMSTHTVSAHKVLQVLVRFDTNLDDYLHLVVPSVAKVAERSDAPISLRREAIQWFNRMSTRLNFSDFSSRIVHPLCRVLQSGSPDLRNDIMATFAALGKELGSDFLLFRPLISSAMSAIDLQNSKFELIMSRLARGQDIEPSDSLTSASPSVDHSLSRASLLPDSSVRKIQVNQKNLERAWNSSALSTRDDWTEWLRRFSVELLRESPSPALRSCAALAQVYHNLARELFNAAFVSCWMELHDGYQQNLVQSLVLAFDPEKAPNVPAEVLQVLLNLAEFMEHDERPLPIDIRRLSEVAEKCQAYAKALHYKELEFLSAPSSNIASLISINNQLDQPEAAVGILRHAQSRQNVALEEEWYEKLRRWDDALDAYETKLEEDPKSQKAKLGLVRSLSAVGDWPRLHTVGSQVCKESSSAISTVQQIAPLVAQSAWNLGRWESFAKHACMVNENTVEGSFLRAVLAVHNGKLDDAMSGIGKTRERLDTSMAALVGESYERAYDSVVRAMELSELEEVVSLRRMRPDERAQRLPSLQSTWSQRLEGVQRNVEVWQRILAVRSLVIPPEQDIVNWTRMCSLCTKSGKQGLARATLRRLMLRGRPDSDCTSDDTIQIYDTLVQGADPRVGYSMLKFMWKTGHRDEAMERMKAFAEAATDDHLAARCLLRLGEWKRATKEDLDEDSVSEVLRWLHSAAQLDSMSYRAWHGFALMNFEAIQWIQRTGSDINAIKPHIVPAVNGFFRSISLAKTTAQQDILRLLTLWFAHGQDPEVEKALQEGFSNIDITTWLQVVPQIIARINSPSEAIRRTVHDLLCRMGRQHPQALIYPLTVASKSQSDKRRTAAESVMSHMRQFFSKLVDEAMLVSRELIRVAILWHEHWHEALEECSRLFFGDRNVDLMLNVVEPLHAMMAKGTETVREVSFQQLFGRDLQEAYRWCLQYKQTRNEKDLSQAWELYYHVFRHINRQLPQMVSLKLQYVSPKLLEASDLELAIPGSYRAGEEPVRIASFTPELTVMMSKQRPRKCGIVGSDGKEHMYLLKGHEDLRQDERVMQLFGLVNSLLQQDAECSRRDLRIHRYAVIPLSPKTGLIEWVPDCDTLHQLIKDFRESRKVLLNTENRLIQQFAQDYDSLPLPQKVEAFRHALNSTTGKDLYRVMWLKARNSEVWLDRRTNYTRSLAVMSMVGYVLGLGDRHPSNLMLHRYTGKVLHIDFGDCFETAMTRDKFPEKIPFRLTRMLINAMEACGIEGNFRWTCENTMRVMRMNRSSLMAMLEAFVYDPLINWRLLETVDKEPAKDVVTAPGQRPSDRDNDLLPEEPRQLQRDERQRGKLQALGEEGDGAPVEVLNQKAVSIVNRVRDKLTGKDFEAQSLDVTDQVDRLIQQAVSHENLCQCYVGWCPFW